MSPVMYSLYAAPIVLLQVPGSKTLFPDHRNSTSSLAVYQLVRLRQGHGFEVETYRARLIP